MYIRLLLFLHLLHNIYIIALLSYCFGVIYWQIVIMRVSLNCTCGFELAKVQLQGPLKYMYVPAYGIYKRMTNWLCLLQNCSISRTTADALVTVPSHYDTLPSNIWQNSNEAQI